MTDIEKLKLDIYKLAGMLQQEIAMMCSATTENKLERMYIKANNNLVMLKDMLYDYMEVR